MLEDYFIAMCLIVGMLTLCTVFATARTSMINGKEDVEANNLFSRLVLSVGIILWFIYCTTQPSWWTTCIYCYASIAITVYCIIEIRKSRYTRIVTERDTFITNMAIYWPSMLFICIISICLEFTWYTSLLFSIPLAITLYFSAQELQQVLKRF